MAASEPKPTMILLDSCTLLWLSADQRKLSLKARDTIENNAGALFISSITAFELAVKCRNRKLELPLPVAEWFPETINFHGIKELQVTSNIAITSALLPVLHNDPCDRIIVATAQMNALKILTCDEHIKQYKQVEVIW